MATISTTLLITHTRGTIAPTGAVVGDLWSDTSLTPTLLKICTSVSPIVFVSSSGGGSSYGAPADATYLTTVADNQLSAEVVVGATPGGELGGTWAAPTVAATHSGSAHHTAFVQADHDALSP